jgi:hypothetical protein
VYFKLSRFGAKHPCRWIDDGPFIKGVSFTAGARIAIPVPEPLSFQLKPLNPKSDEHGPEMPEAFFWSIPLFRDDLIEAMKAGGVDNFDLYAAVIAEPDGKRTYTNYKAVNIVGTVSAADMGRSKATVHTGGPVIDVDFDELVLDGDRARGALIFRLAEATSSIFVHQRLRDHLLKSGFDKLEFLEPRDAFV